MNRENGMVHEMGDILRDRNNTNVAPLIGGMAGMGAGSAFLLAKEANEQKPNQQPTQTNTEISAKPNQITTGHAVETVGTLAGATALSIFACTALAAKIRIARRNRAAEATA